MKILFCSVLFWIYCSRALVSNCGQQILGSPQGQSHFYNKMLFSFFTVFTFALMVQKLWWVKLPALSTDQVRDTKISHYITHHTLIVKKENKK